MNPHLLDRYSRQIMLPQVGLEGQQALNDAKVLVIGAGGLGVPVLQYLVGAGVGYIRLVDDDTIEISNLHRQPIYGGFIGQPKVVAAQQLMQQLNPNVQVDALVQTASPSQLNTLLDGIDLVLDCADSHAVSYVLSDACHAKQLPLIVASALGTNGYVGGFCGAAPSLRAVFPAPANTATCATAGVLGPVPGMLGLLQAQMALAYLLNIDGASPLGQLICWDMRNWRFSGFRFDQAPEPGERIFAFIDRQQLTPRDWVIELRDAQEAPEPICPQAQRLRVDDLLTAPLPVTDQRLVLACASGIRSWRAAEQLASHWSGDIALMAARLA